MQNNCTPPKNVMIQIVDAQPVTGSPNTHFLIITNRININEAKVNTNPDQAAIVNGACEKLIIPSSEYLNNFQKLHFVFPAIRSTFLYGNQICLKSNPTENTLRETIIFTH